jgi:pimeloyl-ACP methyl ester carboxylesterase
MHPFYSDEPNPARRRLVQWHRVLAALRLVGRFLLTDPLAHWRSGNLRIDDGPRWSRWMRGVSYRLACLPILLILVTTTLVYCRTHPAVACSDLDPTSLGIYYDPVTFMSEDGSRLDGWLVPVLDAQHVLTERDNVLRHLRPAVILAHDFGQTRVQMLPLVQPLHEQGLIVLAIDLRGVGSALAAGQTFGVNEATDVRAAVEMLRRRAFVDPTRIGLIGVGCGANAVVIAAQQDPGIAALVLDGPMAGGDQAIADHVGPRQPLFRWMNSFCLWTFDIGYGVDAHELDLSRYEDLRRSRPWLQFNSSDGPLRSPARLAELQRFLERTLVNEPSAAAQ